MGTYKNKDMVKASYYYYKKGLTQSEIAEKMGMSRQKVNRILKSALEENIVNIIIAGIDNSNVELESKLEDKFNLKRSIVISAIDDKDIISNLGIAGADYLEEILKKGDIIGVTWGQTLSEVAKRLGPNEDLNISPVQLIGGTDVSLFKNLSPDVIARLFAKKLGGEAHLLFAPVIVETKEIKDAIISDYSLRSTFEYMDKCNVIMAGIGGLNEITTMYKDDRFNREIVDHLVSRACIGDIGFRFFNKDGEAIEQKYDERTIGYNILERKSKALVIGIAGGKGKFDAILGALKGKYLDVLITDNETAERLIQI